MPQYFPQYEVPSSTTPWQSYELTEMSSSSSYSNFTGEVELTEDLSRIGCMSPYSGHSSYINLYGNEDIQYEGYNQTSSYGYPNLF